MFEVYDENLIKHDLIGTGTLNIVEYTKFTENKEWVEIFYK